MTGTLKGTKPRGLLKWFLRMPIWLYRVGLGWMMGKRFIMLTHTGRKSGLARNAVIEVVHFDPTSKSYTVASGWGEKSDWFQNIMKNPEVMISTHKGDLKVRATHLTAQDGAAMLHNYAKKHPAAFRALTRMMLGNQSADGQIDVNAIAQILPVISFVPR